MKKLFYIVLSSILLGIGTNGWAQNASSYQTATWPGFRKCAISYTFDDGCANQFTKAIPMFDEYGYKLTLFTVTGWGPNWTKLQSAAKNGHEVANHTATHSNLSSATIAAQKTDIETANNLINKNISFTQCVTMATPYCAKGNDSLAASYFIAVRGCQGFIEGKTPASFYNVSSIVCGNQGIIKTSDYKIKANQAASSNGWLVYLIHEIDNGTGYSPLPSDTLRATLQYLSENNSKFWVNTFGNVARYIKERNCVSVSETSVQDTKITLEVTDTLSNNEIFNFPVTFRRLLPEGWNAIFAYQNGDSIHASIVEDNSVQYIQFDAVPDGGTVKLSSKVLTGAKSTKWNSSLNQFDIWYQGSQLMFLVPESCQPNPTLSLYDLKGARLQTFNKLIISNGKGWVDFNRSNYETGIYLLTLCDQKNAWSKKLNLQ
ncbi:MAG TPA: polysaccharide deacetylase family protein [Prolixibacteraceae bacterium]|nr:polysaccharide deacetylase family protein [Prolixibacteraceae bacterium]HPS11698.1 polysaccharide deacetylase family protein [Prolixibacteraceae bacterium]